MSRFYKLKVSEINRETPDAVSVGFEIPAEAREAFKYIQGQYLTFRLNIKGEDLRRSYSLCTSPLVDSILKVAVKKVEGGRVSGYFNDALKTGDILEVMPPMGNFYTQLDSKNKKNYVLFAGGSGITPMMSILKTVLRSEPSSTITLFYGNRDEQSIIFRKELDELASQNKDRLTIKHILEKPSDIAFVQGMITSDVAKSLVSNNLDLSKDNEFFICGPAGMMDSVKNALEDIGMDRAKVHIEYFTASAPVEIKPEGPSTDSVVTVILDGEETVLNLSSDGSSILDAALDADVDVPFACKGAVCCTCRAKLIEGKVRMDMNYALSEAEVAEGYILTCQSHPLTPKVVVDYDQN